MSRLIKQSLKVQASGGMPKLLLFAGTRFMTNGFSALGMVKCQRLYFVFLIVQFVVYFFSNPLLFSMSTAWPSAFPRLTSFPGSRAG